MLLYLMFTKTGIEGLKRIIADITGSRDTTKQDNSYVVPSPPMSGGSDKGNLVMNNSSTIVRA